jgi:hypothetical protein
MSKPTWDTSDQSSRAYSSPLLAEKMISLYTESFPEQAGHSF